MGGDAFPNTSRLSEEEYKRICDLVKHIVNQEKFNEIRLGIPVEVKDKASLCIEMGKGDPYGDVDIIIGVDTEKTKGEIIESLKHDLGVIDEIRTSSDYSMLTKERYQVDLKFCSVSNFEFLLAFKGNNDFGALLGHLMTPFRLKWSDQGLMLKLKCEGVSNIGTAKADFLLTNNIEKVCNFLGIPYFCLDGKTRLSSKDIYNVLTCCKLYANNENYDQKYKIKERRKRRPVANAFFDAIEADDNDSLFSHNANKFNDDKVYNTLINYKNRRLDYDEYIEEISDYFGKKEEVRIKWQMMKENQRVLSAAEVKFNFYILKEWFPSIDQAKLGKVMARVKSSKSGNGPNGFHKWVEETNIDDIQRFSYSILQDIKN